MNRMVTVATLLCVLTFGPLAGTIAAAQDATPEMMTAGPCEAPELPPGTPTPMEAMASPAAMDEMEAMASPEAATEEMTPPEAPAGTPISGAEADAAATGLENFINCLNAGEYLAAAALTTDDFLTNFLGVTNPYDLPPMFEDPNFPFRPVEIRMIGEVRAYDDGRVSVDWIYAGLFNEPGLLGSERWFFVEEDGYHKLDNIMPAPAPEGVVPDAFIVEVQLVNYAFALSTTPIPAGPVIFRMANLPAANEPHVGALATYVTGTSPQQLIQGEVAPLDDATGFLGAAYLEPGQSGDIIFEQLEPGTYFLICDVETADGTPHYELGMVAEITVE